MTDSADVSRSQFDWRSLLLLAVLATSFLLGRLSISGEVQRLRTEINLVSRELGRTLDQQVASMGIPTMAMMHAVPANEVPAPGDTEATAARANASHDAGDSPERQP